MEKPIIQSDSVSKGLLRLNMIIAFIYFSWWFIPSHVGNPFLYGLLVVSELYHVIMAYAFWHTVYPRHRKLVVDHVPSYVPSVDVFITVAGEPVDIVKRTIEAAKKMTYPNLQIYVLNDTYVSGKDNWEAYEVLARELGVHCITRRVAKGAKAGNINNGLSHSSSDLVVIFDADMVPHQDFLTKTTAYFAREEIGFVQSPQYYINQQKNMITAGAWEQQNFFFGPIMRGKDSVNAAFICGTNVVIRRSALVEVGGVNEQNIAEDFLTSLFIHQKKWQSVYVPEVLAEGLAPEDLLSYYKQQHRWARGSLEIFFKFNPFFRRGLTFGQRIQYLGSSLYYLNGLIVLIDCLIPLFFLFFRIQAVAATTTSFALFFIPYMCINLYTIFLVSAGSITFRAISFSQSSFFLQLQALGSLLLGRKVTFSVTAKKAQEGNFLFLIYPHLLYLFLSTVGIATAVYRFGLIPSVVTNSAWALFNIVMFFPFILAGYNWRFAGRLFGQTVIPEPKVLPNK